MTVRITIHAFQTLLNKKTRDEDGFTKIKELNEDLVEILRHYWPNSEPELVWEKLWLVHSGPQVYMTLSFDRLPAASQRDDLVRKDVCPALKMRMEGWLQSTESSHGETKITVDGPHFIRYTV